ncbi:coiled-coil domain-containing protein 86 [Rhinoderma darwinii]|uniref:coiled-coil domain-containing protein 86 n=1 Tax=Rhinoderma darwinii TaxID=43563 RepID=UPI003F6722DF
MGRRKSGLTGTPVRRSRRRGAQGAKGAVQEKKIMAEVQAEEGRDKEVQAAEGRDKEVQAAEGRDKEVQAAEGRDKEVEGRDKEVQAELSRDKEVQAAEGPELLERRKKRASLKRKREAAAAQKEIPPGRPKSGRVWKENKKRFSGMVRDRPLRSSWEVKMKQRQEKKLMKGFAQQLKDEKQQEKEDKKKRREENLKRKLENERRAEVVQVIRNPSKLKRARKKQLRSIEKRDTLMMSQAGKRLSQKKTAPSKESAQKGPVSR